MSDIFDRVNYAVQQYVKATGKRPTHIRIGIDAYYELMDHPKAKQLLAYPAGSPHTIMGMPYEIDHDQKLVVDVTEN